MHLRPFVNGSFDLDYYIYYYYLLFYYYYFFFSCSRCPVHHSGCDGPEQ